MRYLSIDLETTGLDPETCQIIEFGCVIDDYVTPLDDLPAFHSYVTHDQINGEPYALAMNAEILWKLAEPKKYPECRFLPADKLLQEFFYWLQENSMCNKPVAAGKNFASFDRQFLRRLPYFSNLELHHRTIDPAMMFFRSTDEVPPDTKTCMERAGISGEVAHNAIEDALMVARLIRYGRNGLRSLEPCSAKCG